MEVAPVHHHYDQRSHLIAEARDHLDVVMILVGRGHNSLARSHAESSHSLHPPPLIEGVANRNANSPTHNSSLFQPFEKGSLPATEQRRTIVGRESLPSAVITQANVVATIYYALTWTCPSARGIRKNKTPIPQGRRINNLLSLD